MKLFFGSAVFIILVVLFLSGCSVIQSVPMEEHPKTMEEFEAEAELYHLENRIDLDAARLQLQKIYPEFEPVLQNPEIDKPFGIVKIYKFLECEDSDDGFDIHNAGTVSAIYMDKNVKKRVSLKDRCSNKMMKGVAAEFYCSGNRPAKRIVNCTCWDDRSCK